MTIQRGLGQPDDHPSGGDLRRTGVGGGIRATGKPPVRAAVRNAKLAALPVAFAGRQALGLGKRAMGRSAEEVRAEIRMRTAQHIFDVLGELKGCAAKLGQLLAIYELALPPELAEPYKMALDRLQESTPAMLPSTVRMVLADQMGSNWRDNFRAFDERRSAGASIGQVHRAVWHDGRPVAVKIMYPGAKESVLADLEQFRRISGLAAFLTPGTDVRAVADALCDSVRVELDYEAESRHHRLFADAYADDPDFHIPAVVARHGDVLITEWLEGAPVTRILTSGTRAERDRAGILMTRFVLDGFARTGMIYGDPHPGNFQLMPDGRLGIVDFGACYEWSHALFEQLILDYCHAVFEGGPADLLAAARRHGFIQQEREVDADALFAAVEPHGEPFRHRVFQVSQPWLREEVVRATRPRLTNVIRDCTIPVYYTPFGRTYLTLLGALAQLETEGGFQGELIRSVPELAPLFARLERREAAPVDLASVRERRAQIMSLRLPPG